MNSQQPSEIEVELEPGRNYSIVCPPAWCASSWVWGMIYVGTFRGVLEGANQLLCFRNLEHGTELALAQDQIASVEVVA